MSDNTATDEEYFDFLFNGKPTEPAKTATLKGFALVRDKNGKPRIDDYKNCPDEIKALLTLKEKEEFEKCL